MEEDHIDRIIKMMFVIVVDGGEHDEETVFGAILDQLFDDNFFSAIKIALDSLREIYDFNSIIAAVRRILRDFEEWQSM